ncbi:MAG: alpha/beta hydrolase family esterase [Thermoguttaceae bacterium]
MNLIPILFATIFAATPLSPGDHTRTVQHDGRTRSYIVHIPPRYDPKQPTPVILVFHGAMTDASITVRFTGLNEKADREGFIAVYPNGTGRFERILTWNGGNCCGSAQWNKVDDVGFTRALLDDLAKVVNVDAKKVFATGISNGGIMCYRLASELSDRIAAIAPVSGTMGMATCNPRRAVSVMHFHGTDDKFVPFKGGAGERSLASINFFSVDRSIQAWVKANGCPEKPAVADEAKKFDDGTTVQRKTYGPGKDDSEVVLFVINGGGHAWPGRDAKLQFLGKSTKNISANDLMWEFFKWHPMK